MGMLIHHTWLEQQKKTAEQVKETKAVEKADEKKPDAVAEKKPVGRRKVSK